MRPARTALSATINAFLFVLTPVFAASTAIALPADTKAPTRPNPLRITATGSYSVSLSWNASFDNSGSLSYVIQASNGYTMTVPQSSTTATFIGALWPYNEYSFTVRAVDAAGNSSANSNTVRATMQPDTSIPSTPTVTVTDIGPHHAAFTWSASDNDPYLSYFVYVNGVQVGHSTTATSGTFWFAQANTSYTVTVKARDHGINFSAVSAPLVFTTDPIDTSDVEPPTTPAAFDAYENGDLELFLTWSQSTDNVDHRVAIRYEITVNGTLAENVVGVGGTSTYGEFGHNVITITAFDSAGNASGSVTITVDI